MKKRLVGRAVHLWGFVEMFGSVDGVRAGVVRAA